MVIQRQMNFIYEKYKNSKVIFTFLGFFFGVILTASFLAGRC